MARTDRPVILITCDVQETSGQPTETLMRLRLNYAAAVAAAGGLPLVLPPEPAVLDPALDLCDGLLLSGSDAGVRVPPLREGFEADLIARALARDLPVLGICHGMQALGQALGDELRRDDPDLLSPGSVHLPQPVPDAPAHPVRIVPGSLLARVTGATGAPVNSLHRHALRGTGRYRVSAAAPDGVIEAIEPPAGRFCLGVQWHPEYRLTEADRRLLHAFVRAARRDAAGR